MIIDQIKQVKDAKNETIIGIIRDISEKRHLPHQKVDAKMYYSYITLFVMIHLFSFAIHHANTLIYMAFETGGNLAGETSN